VADLDPQTAEELCSALAAPLAVELGAPALLRDVTGQNLRWDLEASDASTGQLLRRISCVRSVSQRIAHTLAHVGNEFWRDVDVELGAARVEGCSVGIGIRALPKRRAERRLVAASLAQRVRDHRDDGTPLLLDPIESIRQGLRPDHDPLAKYFYDIELLPAERPGPARVSSATHDDLGYRIPDLHEEVLPVVAKKQRKHRELAWDLTLVVEVHDAGLTEGGLAEARASLAEAHRGFRSVYLARRDGTGRFEVAKLY
jgi:hypothetical protein